MTETASLASADLRVLQLADFRDRHRGEKVVVCGCGESLKLLEQPERFVTIGVNDVGRLFTPDYLVVVNPRSQFSAGRFPHVERSNANVLFTQLADLGVPHPNVVHFRLGRYGGTDLSAPNVLHYTQNSPYVALCLAAHMGAKRIGLIGVDFTENHFFGQTGTHPLTSQLSTIDEQYRRLGEALRKRGIEVVNLSPSSRLTAFPKMTIQKFIVPTAMTKAYKEAPLKIVSYATTPIAGVPLALAHCINARTPHQAHCVWATNDYGNGVRFENGIEWTRMPEEAELRLREADVVIVHNGKMEQRHTRFLEKKVIITMAHNYMWNVDRGFVEKGWPGLVVGQYQATLAEFAGWRVVPNPVPFWETGYSPERKPDIITICYTPTGTHERYPPEHRLYWHSKGYETTLRVLDRLAQRFKINVETVRGNQISHAESLAMKRRAHIVIDECVTGSYHRNSLEGLAAGCVVVNGVGLLPGVAEMFQKCAIDATVIPFVYASLDTLETVLVSRIECGTKVLAADGSSNRRWIERHWEFARQWEWFWEPLVRRALEQVGSAGLQHIRSRIMSTQVRESVPTGRVLRKLKRGVSVVIPHGGAERITNLAVTLANLKKCEGVSEVIIAEMGERPLARDIAERWSAKYVFCREADVFRKARAINCGSGIAERDLLLWLDNDLLMLPGFIEKAESEMRRRDLDCLLPYSSLNYLNEAESKGIIEGTFSADRCNPAKIVLAGRGGVGGAVLVRTQFFLRFGGIPEGFCGWGGEDNAWLHKARLLGKTALTGREDQPLFHLFHADSGGHNPDHHSRNPYYRQNVALLEEIRGLVDSTQFLRRFPPDDHLSCPWDTSRKVLVLWGTAPFGFEWAAVAVAQGLRGLYGIDVEMVEVRDGHWQRELRQNAGGIVCVGQRSFELGLLHSDLATLRQQTVVMLEPGEAEEKNITRLLQSGTHVLVEPLSFASQLGDAGLLWKMPVNVADDVISLAVAVSQPLSYIMGTASTKLAASDIPVAQRQSERICIGIYVQSEPWRLEETLRFLRAYTRPPIDILLLGDGPDAETKQLLERLRDLPRLTTDDAHGAAACFNCLTRQSEADILVFLESGSLVGPDWLDLILRALKASPQNGLSGPSTNSAWSVQCAFPGRGGSEADVLRTSAAARVRFGESWRTLEPTYCLADFCYVVRREVVVAIGDADEGYGLGPCWEMDYTIRAERAGYRAVWAQGAYVFRHPFTKKRDKDEREWFQRSKHRYQDKFCGLRLRGERDGYVDHCRGGICPHFAPLELITKRLPLSKSGQAKGETPRKQPQKSSLPLVSCIMPTRNRHEWAQQAVAYFLRQDYPNRELLIVDDSGQDHAVDFPCDPGIRYVYLPGRLSLGQKRNRACELAKGMIIAHWDDDDWYSPSRLRAQVEPILAGTADITALYDTVFFDLDKWQFWRCSTEVYQRLFALDVHGGTLVFRREVFKGSAHYPSQSIAEDAAFLRQAVSRGARLTRLSGKGLYLYLRHQENTWKLAYGELSNDSGWQRIVEPSELTLDRDFYLNRSPVGVRQSSLVEHRARVIELATE